MQPKPAHHVSGQLSDMNAPETYLENTDHDLLWGVRCSYHFKALISSLGNNEKQREGQG